jgi:hypothetical protein
MNRSWRPKNDKTVTFKKKKSHIWARHQDILTDWPSVAMWLWLWFWEVGALGPSLLLSYFAIGHIASGVSSVFYNFVSHFSSVFFRIMRLIAFEAWFTAVLHPGFLVSCHSFLILFLYFNSRSRPDRSQLKSANVIFTGRQPVCRGNRGWKVACRFIGLNPQVNFESGWY